MSLRHYQQVSRESKTADEATLFAWAANPRRYGKTRAQVANALLVKRGYSVSEILSGKPPA